MTDPTDQFCTVWRIEHNYLNSIYANLRGLCAATKFDKLYPPRFAENNLLMYLGDFDTIIEYDQQRSMWSMYVSYNLTIRAESLSLYGSLAKRNQQWIIFNDSAFTVDGDFVFLFHRGVHLQ